MTDFASMPGRRRRLLRSEIVWETPWSHEVDVDGPKPLSNRPGCWG